MNTALVPADWAAQWCDWALAGLIDGAVALALVAVAWGIFGRWFPPRLGAWLFAVVMLKCVVPLPVELGLARSFNSSDFWPLQDWIAEGAIPAASMAVASVSEAGGAGLTWPRICVLAWVVCVVLGVVRFVWLAIRTRRLVSKSRPASIDAEALVARAGCRGPVAIRVSSALHSPVVAGIRRPVVMLPEGIESRLSSGQLRWAIAHELAHVRSRDLVWQFAETMLRVVLFFNPVVWIASAQAARLRERACDEAALKAAGISRRLSAEGFIALVEWASVHRRVALAGLGMGAAGREARSRVRRLASGPARGPGARGQAFFSLICLAIALPSYRVVEAQSEAARIKELEKRVADLEQQLKAKSRLEALRERAIQRAHERARAEERRFSAEQLREIERLYQEAKRADTGEGLARGFQPLLDRFPSANRTGCAILLMARVTQGEAREALLKRAIREHGDACFLDGTNVGGVARLMLAQDAGAAGRADEARRLRDEIAKGFSNELDFGAVPLVDVISAPTTSR